jgi:DNA processing protein
MISEDLFYQIALRQTERIGDITAKALYSHFGSARAVFEADKIDLAQVAAVHRDMIEPILAQKSFAKAEAELKFIENQGILPMIFSSSAYPKRLQCFDDAPFLLFYKGAPEALHALRTVAIIGTRRPTDYGTQHCERLVAELAAFQPVIVSGLAFGIDICAHRKSVAINLPTVAVVAHGLDIFYPHEHRKTALQMIENGGGVLTEFMSQTRPNRENFPMRNRIIAALADTTIVVETARQGGSIITAELANDYKKDVFAVPGRLGDHYAEGCNWLIRSHKATLLESADEIAQLLGWSKRATDNIKPQTTLFLQLSPDEQKIMQQLASKEQTHLDALIQKTGLTTSKLAACLLELEFKALVRALPGKNFRLA